MKHPYYTVPRNACLRDLTRIGFAVSLLLWVGGAGSSEPAGSGPSQGEKPTQPGGKGKEDAIKTIVLSDIHPLYGGQYLLLRQDGSGVSRTIARRPGAGGLHERRFDIPPSAETVRRLAKLLRDHSFFKIHLKERAGVPDEARPTITVTLASGKSASVSKWANDKHPDFDPIYQALLEQVKAAQKGKPVYDGPYDPQRKVM